MAFGSCCMNRTSNLESSQGQQIYNLKSECKPSCPVSMAGYVIQTLRGLTKPLCGWLLLLNNDKESQSIPVFCLDGKLPFQGIWALQNREASIGNKNIKVTLDTSLFPAKENLVSLGTIPVNKKKAKRQCHEPRSPLEVAKGSSSARKRGDTFSLSLLEERG